MPRDLSLFLPCSPGFEDLLHAELTEGTPLTAMRTVRGGVTGIGGWRDVWRLNLTSRIANRVMVRVAEFPATHISQLDRQARKVAWNEWLQPGVSVRADVTAKKSKLFHSAAVGERVVNAVVDSVRGSAGDKEADVTVFARLEHDRCTLSLDTTGPLLYQRGYKTEVGRAPLRESMAAAFLRACGYRPGEPLLDPMCGSGTIPLEAAGISTGNLPGAGRRFAFERFASFETEPYAELIEKLKSREVPGTGPIFGSDRDKDVIQAAIGNAERAGLADAVRFAVASVGNLTRPEGPPGLLLTNPPYGARLGDVSHLRALHATLGQKLRAEFGGWRVGIITAEESLAKATGLTFTDVGPPIPHGKLKVRLYHAILG